MNADDLKKFHALTWNEIREHEHGLIYLVCPDMPNVGRMAACAGLDFRGEEPVYWVSDEQGVLSKIYKSDVDSGIQLVFSQAHGIIIETRQTVDRWEEEKRSKGEAEE